MKVYIDSDFKCHITNADGALREIETDFFDGKSNEFIEGFRFIPSGERWTRSDGVVFEGEMIAPWKDWDKLDSAQRVHEQKILAEYTEYLKILGVEV